MTSKTFQLENKIGTWDSGLLKWKISRSNGTSEKELLFSQTECSIIQTNFDIRLLQQLFGNLQDYNLIKVKFWMEFTQTWMLFTICPYSEQTGLPIQMAIKLNFPFSPSTPSVPISNFHFFRLNLPSFTYFCSIGESLFSKFCILTPSAKRSFSFAFPVNKNKAKIRTMSLYITQISNL